MVAPCMGCGVRYLGCHNRCTKYLMFDFQNKHRTEVKKREEEYKDYKIKTMDKERRRRGYTYAKIK